MRSVRDILAEAVVAVPQFAYRGGGVGSGLAGQIPSKRSSYPDQSFPFQSRAAQEVFELMLDLQLQHPDASPNELARLAMEAARVTRQDFAPEDFHLLQMALDWLQTGPPRPQGSQGSWRKGIGWDAQGVAEERVPSLVFDPEEFERDLVPKASDSGRMGTKGGSDRWHKMVSRIQDLLRGR